MNGSFHLDLEKVLPGLIWAVILVVWAVGKVVNAARDGKKGTPPPASPASDQPARKRAGGDELRDFLETLTGQKLAPPEERPTEAEPRYTPPPVVMSQPVPATPHVLRPAAAPVIKPAPEKRMSVFRPTQIKGTEAALVGLQSMRLPGTSLPKAQTWAATQKLVPAGLREREELRRAMVQRIVLGPPVALGGKASSPDLREF